uniref:Immunoglobulin V-set domain-containing protein n=1 Tax=Oncorhynchus mykiss TaxID=8022 RepID=A0A8C7Q7G3_ONCMY
MLDFVLCVSGLVSVLVFQSQTMMVRTGDTIILQCSNVTTAVGHTAWFKQVNGSEPVCISSMYSHHNGFQPSHVEMFISNRIIFLKITEVNVADSGLYCCGMYDQYFIFTNMTFLMIPGEDDEPIMYPFPLVDILGVVTAVLLIVILILVLKIIRDAKRQNTEIVKITTVAYFMMFANPQIQDSDALNYAALNFTSKKRKMEKRREKELDTHVVYAATR